MYYVQQSGKRSGPYGSAKIKALLAEGKLQPSAQVSASEAGPWSELTTVSGLLSDNESVPAATEWPEASSRSDRGRHSDDSGRDSERTLWQGRSSQLTNLFGFLVWGLAAMVLYILAGAIMFSDAPFVFAMFFFLAAELPLVRAVWLWVRTRSVQYELTTERLRVSTGVFSRRIDEVELYRVKDSSLSQSFFERIFRLGTVDLSTSDKTTQQVTIKSLPIEEARSVREQIRDLSEQLRESKRVQEIDYST